MTDHQTLDTSWPALLDLAAGRNVAPREDCFWNLYASIALGRGASTFVVGQMGQSLDGRVATPSGKSRNIGGPDSIRHLHRLRALVDAVLVGVGTVIADDPLLTVREVAGPSPMRVVIDPHFRLPAAARMLRGGDAPVFAIQSEARDRPASVIPIVIPEIAGTISPKDIIAALAARGVRRLLVEGGPVTLSAFLAASALDRLHVSVAPLILGSGPTGLNLPPIDELTQALRPRARLHRLGDDILFDCDLT